MSVSAEPLVVVFSDVDSLTASAASPPTEAAPLLREIGLKRLPLVLSSTRTRAEVAFIQQELGLHAPFIYESGGAISMAQGYFRGHVHGTRAVGGTLIVEFGRPYSEVKSTLRQTAASLDMDVVGLSDLSIEETALAWGVTPLEASRVKMREYGEPFRILRGTDRRDLLFRALRARGLACTTGGRSEYVGAPSAERMGIALLTRLYRETFGPVVTVGLGRLTADAELLAQVDVPLIVSARDEPPQIMKPQSARRTQWLTAVLQRSRWTTRLAGVSKVRRRLAALRFAPPEGV